MVLVSSPAGTSSEVPNLDPKRVFLGWLFPTDFEDFPLGWHLSLRLVVRHGSGRQRGDASCHC